MTWTPESACGCLRFRWSPVPWAGCSAWPAESSSSPAVAGPVALGSVVGSLVGARILMAVSNERIRLLFVVVLVALAVHGADAAPAGTILDAAMPATSDAGKQVQSQTSPRQ